MYIRQKYPAHRPLSAGVTYACVRSLVKCFQNLYLKRTLSTVYCIYICILHAKANIRKVYYTPNATTAYAEKGRYSEHLKNAFANNKIPKAFSTDSINVTLIVL